ncbi:MAG: DUF2240 family protein [Candidatus Poseidoniaceae archaeon]|nr:DUF2240 family protein [Candidatus Poseidoniaceae archaeon]
MSNEVEDIRRVLAICFRSEEALSPDDLERVLVFDMDWMNTDTAHDAITALTFAGWLKEDNGLLKPNCDIRGVNAPLGWQPRPSRLTAPAVHDGAEISPEVVEIVEAPVIHETSPDPRSRLEKRLIRFISAQSGLDKEEVARRADRKVSALRHCTTWLALCLVSRDQGLEMGAIIDSLTASS